MNMIRLLEGISIHELTKIDTFDSIIEDHYEKFLLLHGFLRSFDSKELEKIKFCNCSCLDFSLNVEVIAGKKSVKKIHKVMNDRLDDYEDERLEAFGVSIIIDPESSDTILIDIQSINQQKEDVIYYGN